jgi:tetratricopeptide (TPR) repeat protein
MRHDYDNALLYVQRALDIAAVQNSDETQLRSFYFLGQIYHDLGDYERSSDLLRKVITALQGDRLYDPLGTNRGSPLISLNARLYLIMSLGAVGSFAEAMVYAEEALQIANTVDRPYERSATDARLCYLYAAQGLFEQAIRFGKGALTLARQSDISIMLRVAFRHLALAHARAGHNVEALWLLEQRDRRQDSVLRDACYAETYFLVGRMESANRLAQRAFKQSRAYNTRGIEARSLWLLGEIALHGDSPSPERAETHYSQALALAQALGMRPLVAHCHYGLGTMYRQMGQYDRARCELSAAVALYREMGMSFFRY